jgi:OOP family OmpA-OmpF porin
MNAAAAEAAGAWGLPPSVGFFTPTKGRRMTHYTSANGSCCRWLLSLSILAGAAASPALQAQTTTPAGGPATSSSPSSSNTTGTPSAAAGGTTTSPSAASNEGYSWIPGTRRGYVGINLGRSDYGTPCGSGGLGCDKPRVAGKVYSGGMFNDYVGMELGYLHMGRADRAGGRTDAQGLNASVVGRVPFGGAFNAFAKGGVTYGRTHVSAASAAGIPTGTGSGWGASYGGGLGWDFNRTSGLVLEWERHDFRFAGLGKRDVDMTTIGYMHRF